LRKTKATAMTTFRKLEHIRAHLQLGQSRAEQPLPNLLGEQASGKRVQKNLSILECDAERLRALAQRDGVSQARLLGAALDAYERMHDKGC
jgi:hypothetical protein